MHLLDEIKVLRQTGFSFSFDLRDNCVTSRKRLKLSRLLISQRKMFYISSRKMFYKLQYKYTKRDDEHIIDVSFS